MITPEYTPEGAVPSRPPIIIPFNGSQADLIQVGRDVAALLEHPGFSHVIAAGEHYARILDNTLEQRAPSDNPAVYADVTGEKRGLREIVHIARGIVENGKQAEREATAEREGGA